jgi:hypothetical protein
LAARSRRAAEMSTRQPRGDRFGGGLGSNGGHGQRVAADLGEPGASPFPRLPPERSGRRDNVGNRLGLSQGRG